MAKTLLYQFAILFSPTEEEAKDGKKPVIVKEITSIFAKSDQEVVMIASRQIPEEYLSTLSQIDIVVRPF